MSSRPSTVLDRAHGLARRTFPLAVVPFLGSLLAVGQILAFATPQGGVGVKFPLPSGLPTLWTFTSTSGTSGGVTIGPPGLSSTLGIGLFVVGFLLTAVLEAGFLGRLAAVAGDEHRSFVDGIREYIGSIVLAKGLRFVVTFGLSVPLFFFPPLAVVVTFVVGYLLYGLPFVIVVEEVGVGTALRRTLSMSLTEGRYLAYAVGYLVVGTALSVVLSLAVLNLGLPGILLGAAIVAVPGLYLTTTGVVVFRDLRPVGQTGTA